MKLALLWRLHVHVTIVTARLPRLDQLTELHVPTGSDHAVCVVVCVLLILCVCVCVLPRAFALPMGRRAILLPYRAPCH
jgi:hypothetical protein